MYLERSRIIVNKMLVRYDLRFRVSYSCVSDHTVRMTLMSVDPTKTPHGVSSMVPPSIYFRPWLSTVANRNGTAIVIQSASTTDMLGVVSHEKYSVRPRLTQYALICILGIVGRSAWSSRNVKSSLLKKTRMMSIMTVRIFFWLTRPKCFRNWRMLGFMMSFIGMPNE